MKKYIRKYKLFFVLTGILAVVCIVDVLFGAFVDSYTSKHSLPGDYAKIDYLMKSADEDMIIIGSSMAINAFIPQIIEDSLNITCFNGGCNFQFLPFFQCVTENILARNKPRDIVLVLQPEELTYNNLGRINLLNVYYNKGNESIDYFVNVDNGQKTVFLNSNLYRYNTIGWRILLSQAKSMHDLGEKGYLPHDIPKLAPTLKDYTQRVRRGNLNSSKVKNLLNIITMCEKAGTNLIVVIPPVYNLLYKDEKTVGLKALEEICSEYNISLINDSQSPFFLTRPDLFYDNVHLNYLGSEIYTNLFIEHLKQLTEQN